MKVGIHHRKGSFSDRWIDYCKNRNIDYKVVNCYDTDIVHQLKDCYALMWHHNHVDFTDTLFAKQLLFSLEQSGKRVFPNFNTGWHYDDKVGQKYLLESINAPFVTSYVFYSRSEALEWAAQTDFPKVFKLRGGAGSSNVKLVRNKSEAKRIITKAFGRGYSQFDPVENLKERIRKFKMGKDSCLGVLKGIGRCFLYPSFSRMMGKERGYVYFQDFIPNNDFDVRLIVIGNRAYGMRRFTRKGDFRASGSGMFDYELKDESLLRIAFDVSKKLNFQTVAFDFIYDKDGKPLIIEVSFAFGTKGSNKCPGYWTNDLKYHKGPFNPQEWMVESVLSL